MMDFIVAGAKVPPVTAEVMREVDRLMIEVYGVTLLQMMENAGRNLAILGGRLLNGSVVGSKVAVAAGRGNNGGGGLAAARHLHNWGADVTVLVSQDSLGPAPAAQLDIVRASGVEPVFAQEAAAQLADGDWDLVVDALIGYGLSGPPIGHTAALIAAANEAAGVKLSLDVPSGLDAGTGRVFEPHVNADATLTLALPKSGLASPSAQAAIGRLFLADIGVPPELYSRLGLSVGPIFAADTIAEVQRQSA